MIDGFLNNKDCGVFFLHSSQQIRDVGEITGVV
jgi:hypothetical protein